MAAFTASAIQLTLKDPATDNYLAARVYKMDGVNGGKPISIGQLVMALCLARATEMERSIIALMDTMEETTSQLERLTAIEEKLIANKALTTTERNFLNDLGVAANITDIESKMDSLNSFSQETMIDLQSQTNKRDQAYDMAANIMKSLNGVQIGIANNM